MGSKFDDQYIIDKEDIEDDKLQRELSYDIYKPKILDEGHSEEDSEC